MVKLFVLLLCVLWSAPSSVAQGPSIRPVFGTRASASLMSVTDGTKCEIEVSGGGSCWTLLPGTVTFSELGGMADAAQLPTALADGGTKGVASFLNSDFNCTAGICGLDYLTGPEAVANKDPAATLGTSNLKYPTQGAVKQYVDSGQKALTNTAITPRGGTARPDCVLGPGSPLTLPADNLTGCDFVQIAELSGTTNFDITGTPVNGQWVTLLIFTTTQRALSWTSGAGKFAAEGITLPTFTRAGGYVLYGFRYNGLSSRWALAASNQSTTYGTAGHVLTGGGAGVEPSFQAPTGGPDGGTGQIHLPVTAVKLPATNPATIDGGENNYRLLFDGATSECAVWGPLRLNPDYVASPVFKWQYSMTSATGAVGISINVSVVAVTPGDAVDVNTKAFATANNCDDTTVPTTLGGIKELSCALTNNDGMVARDMVKIQICRATTDSADTAATSDMEGIAAALEYSK